MSANVWFEEIYRAFIKEIEKTVKYTTESGDLAFLSSAKNQVVVRKPEEDFKIETYPCVSLQVLTNKYNPIRDSNNLNPVVMSIDETTNTAVLQDPSVPIDVNIQVDFWAKFQTDIDLMTRTWLYKHHRQFNLPIVDDGGNDRNSNVIRRTEPMNDASRMSNIERTPRQTISYTIWVDLDEEINYNGHIVTKRNITGGPK